MKISIVIHFFVMGLFVPRFSNAETANLGLIDGIWFSQQEYVVGDEIVLHTAIFNNSDHTVLGTVEFYDNKTLLGSRSFEVTDQHIKELTLTTTASEGEHIFSAKITESKTTLHNGEITDLTPIVVASDSMKVVERDTDRDGLPDDEDLDDDDDGYLDTQEIQLGTDPLDAQETPKSLEDDNDTQDNNDAQYTIEGQQDLIDSLIKTLEKYQHAPDISDTSIGSGGEPVVLPKVLQPEVIVQYADSHPKVAIAAQGINTFQNKAVDFFSSVRAKNSQKLGDGKIIEDVASSNDSKISLGDDTVQSSSQNQTSSRFERVIRLIWGLLLSLGILVFSCLWCIVLLSIGLIYLLVRLVFKKFGKEGI